MRQSDTCYYMNITAEENSAFILSHPNENTDSKESKLDKSPSYVYDSNGTGMTRIESAIASVGEILFNPYMMMPEISQAGMYKESIFVTSSNCI